VAFFALQTLRFGCLFEAEALTAYSDPFLKMIEHNKTYGFTIAVKELRETVPNIFRYASAYKRMNNMTSKGLWEMFVDPIEPEEKKKKKETPSKDTLPEEILRSDPNRNTLPPIDPEAMEGESYNMCHFWSNFEIARLDWFRSKEYNDFFEMMDRSGGFWMERVSFPIMSCCCSCGRNIELTECPSVGRCSHPFAGSRSPPGPWRYPLLPRLWLPPYHDPALSGQRAGAAAAS